MDNETMVAGLQERVEPWFRACFPADVCNDRQERGDRFLEEALELLQSGGYDRSRVTTLVDYVWDRPVGEPSQEVGGVMITLAAYCIAHGLDMHDAGDVELARISAPEVMEKIRAKQASKRGLHGPLPVPAARPAPSSAGGELRERAGHLRACFDDAVNVLPWLRQRLDSGQQFNAYDRATNEEDVEDEDAEMRLGIGPISDFQVIFDVDGRQEALMVEAALKVATLAPALLDQIDALTVRVGAMRTVLEPFAELAENFVGDDEDDLDRYIPDRFADQKHVRVGHLRAARAILAEPSAAAIRNGDAHDRG